MALAQLSKVRIEYFPHGEGPERILFIHGFSASARIWGMVQEALPAERYTTVAINNRGAGGPDAPPNEFAHIPGGWSTCPDLNYYLRLSPNPANAGIPGSGGSFDLSVKTDPNGYTYDGGRPANPGIDTRRSPPSCRLP
jgi:pimeloyl-ACP methyl ester carboxylesterase